MSGPVPSNGHATDAAAGPTGSRTRRPDGARRVTAYAVGLLATAAGVFGWLLVSGAGRPPLAAVALLVVPLTVCMNRFVFFANEVGVTAEAATLFAAIVGFRSDSPLLGPMLLALLVGVLDGRHWERRAFLRMSYNSGSQALTVLAAAWVFGGITSLVGSSSTAVLGASALAALVYVAVETGCGVVLVVILGEPARAALRHQLPVNALALPLAVFGAAIALTVAPTSWWLVAVSLVPTAFVPELVLVGMRRTTPCRRVVVALAVASAALVVLVLDLLVRGPRFDGLVGIVALALLLGVDGRPPPRRVLPPAAALVFATAAGLAAGSWLAAVAAAACVTAFVAIAAGRGLAEAAWSLPLALTAAAIATVADSTTMPGLPTVVGVVAVVTAAATWGALPWPSRILGPWGARRRRGWPVLLLAGIASIAVAASAWCLVAGGPVVARVAVAASAAALSCAAAGVRQWRFAPAIRRRDGLILAAGGLVVAVSAVLGTGRTSGAIVAPGCVAATAIALSVATACARAVRGARRNPGRPEPDRAGVL